LAALAASVVLDDIANLEILHRARHVSSGSDGIGSASVAAEPGQQSGVREAPLLSDLPGRNVAALCDLEQVSVRDAQQRCCLFESEDRRGVLSERGAADDKSVAGGEVLADGVLDKPAFALSGAVGDVAQSLRLIGGQPDVQWNIASRHIGHDIK